VHGVVLVYCCHDNLSLKMDLDDIVASAMNLDDIEVLLYGCHDNFALEMDLDDNVALGKG